MQRMVPIVGNSTKAEALQKSMNSWKSSVKALRSFRRRLVMAPNECHRELMEQ